MLSQENACAVFELFDRVEPYMRSIQKKNGNSLVPICKSKLGTCFKGCIMNIRSIKNLYNELILRRVLNQIPIHSLSQDHLEVGFDDIFTITNFQKFIRNASINDA